MNALEAIKKTLLFRNLPDQHLTKLAAMAQEVNLGPGTDLFREGQELTEFFVIVIGSVRVLKNNRSGDTEELTVLGTGSYLGEVEFSRTDRHAAATIQTIETTTVLSLSFVEMEKLCAEDKDLAVHVYRALARALALRLAETNEAAANYRMVAVKRRN